jgi:hypothetical protein
MSQIFAIYEWANPLYVVLLAADDRQGQSANANSLWLDDAFSNYVVFIAGMVAGITGWLVVRYISRQKPQIIEVLRKETVSMLEINSQVRDDIRVEYKSNVIDRLPRTTFDILNRGDTPVTNFSLSIQTQSADLPKATLGHILIDPSGNEVQDSIIHIHNKDISASIKFLNPFRLYRDRLTLYIFTSEPLRVVDARGRGLGWGVAYFDQLGYEKELSGILIATLSGGPYSNVLAGILKSLQVVISRSLIR